MEDLSITRMPFEMDAERTVLGQIMIRTAKGEETIIDRAVSLAPPEDYSMRHAKILRAMLAASKEGPVNPITIHSELKRLGQDSDIPLSYLASLIDDVPDLAMKPYAKLIRDSARKRRFLTQINEWEGRVYDGEKLSDIIESAETEIFAMSDTGKTQENPKHVAPIAGRLADFYEQKGGDPNALIGLSTGFKDIDRATLGLTPGITLIAARPRMGKTSLATNIGCNVALAGGSVYFASIESSAEKIVQRILSSVSRIDSYRLRQGFMNPDEWGRLGDTLGKLAITRFVIDDTPDLTPEQLLSRCRQYKAQHGLDLVVVDYLLLMARRLMFRRKYRDLRTAVQEVGASYIELSTRLNVPVLAVTQLNREPDQREDHRPQLSDLAESASLEQDADIVMFLYREEVYDPKPENANLAKVIFGKQRDGDEGEVDLAFIKPYTRFEDLAYEARPPKAEKKYRRSRAWGAGASGGDSDE